jgi:uncharacterized protein
MDTLTTNKNFIRASIALVILLALFVLALLVNEVKASRYIGRGTTPLSSISVGGKGEVTAVSDIATLYVTVSKDASTTKEAQNLLNQQVTKTLDYLKTKKIEDKDIKSEYGGVSPKYSYSQPICITYPCPSREPRITGYTATQSITVKVREVDIANDIRTGLADLGITNISGPTFSIDNEDALRDEARSLAIKDAREKAEVLARDLGVRLGSVASFSENGGYYPMYESKAVMNQAADAGSATPPSLPRGENKITTNVTVVFEIK